MPPGLKIATLGGLTIRCDGEAVADLASRKVEALLVYLACTRRVHRREMLAEMFWEERTQAQAMSNLRVALSSLRKHLTPYVIIARDTVVMNPEAAIWLDVAVMEEKLSTSQTEEAVASYQGDFLEGFYIRGARGFDDWTTVERERVRQLVLDALTDLVAYHLKAGTYRRGIPHSRRLLQIDPLLEEGHRQLMVLLAYSGQRGAALAQYESCLQLLRDELGVAPTAETTALYEQIQAGELEAPAHSLTPQIPASPIGTIRGYELQERIGAGGFGQVFLALQPSVGRQVAVKVILPQYANHPDFIRRFEAEARIVARLEHPHIVPLYDYWREPDGAYLVMRWLRGGNLHQSLQRGPWSAKAAAQLLEQVAGALAVAHRQGVVHRDIKPANILLDDQDNAYLSDFGIAKDLMEAISTTASDALPGSLWYISPEQAQSQPLAAQSDLYSLGVVMYEVLTGAHPYSESTPADQLVKRLTEPIPSLRGRRPDLPQDLDTVIQKATAKDCAERYPDALAFAAAFREAVADPGQVAVAMTPDWTALEIVNPYKGLRPFDEADAGDFFGREALTERLLERLRGDDQWSRFLAVVGPSGSGKSSVVKAGLLPALRHGAVPGSESWFVVEMMPGPHPLDELEIGLLQIAASQPTGLMEHLRRDERGLWRAARLVLPPEDVDNGRSELLLVIDQFEELYTRAVDKSESEHLLQLIYSALHHPRGRVRVIITLRADFYDRPLTQPAFSRLMRERTEVVVPLSTEELGAAIRKPVDRAGAKFEEGLVTTIVTDVSEQPGALPMLQYALTELFERRDGRLMTHEAYQAIGGVSGALARRAEEVYAGLDEAGQSATRQLFLRLVSVGEGSGDSVASPDTRRRVLRSELLALQTLEVSETSSVLNDVIDLYGRHRLLTFDRDPGTREPTAEVAHEALLPEWARLRSWLGIYRAAVRTQRLLGAAAAEWVAADRDPSFLLRGSRLSQFEEWMLSTDLALTKEEAIYLDASLSAREARQAEETARMAREAALEQRSRYFLRTLVVVMALATVTAMVLALYAFGQRGEAQHQAALVATNAAAVQDIAAAEATAREAAEGASRLATARELAAFALTEIEQPSDPSFSLALLLAREAVSTTWQTDHYVAPTAETALRNAIGAAPSLLVMLTGHTKPVYQAVWSPDGKRLATASGDGTARVWDVSAGLDTGPQDDREQLTLTGHSGAIHSLAFNADGTQLVTASSDRTARVWDVRNGHQLMEFEHPTRVDWVAWSPDGGRIVTVGGREMIDAAPTARVWNAQTGEQLTELSGPTLEFESAAWSPGGRQLLLFRGPAAYIWDAQTNTELGVFDLGSEVLVAVWNPEGDRIFTGGEGGIAVIWDVEARLEIKRLEGPTAAISAAAWSPDGTQILTAGPDRIVRIWDIQTGQQLGRLHGHTDIVNSVAWSPDGARVASASFDGTARIWSARVGSLSQLEHASPVYSAAWSSDGGRIVTAGGLDRVAHIWDAACGAELGQLRGHLTAVWRAAWSPNGRRVATAGFDGTARVWDAQTGQELLQLEWRADKVLAVAWSPDGSSLLTAAPDGVAYIWDAQTGQELGQLDGHTAQINEVSWSPDGARIVTAGGDKTAIIWDAVSQTKIHQLLHGARVNTATWSPNGAHIVTGGDDSIARIWDAKTGQEVRQLEGHRDAVWSAAWSPDGGRIVTASGDHSARIWDAQTGELRGLLEGHTSTVWSAVWSPDGAQILTASGDHTARIWPVGIEGLLALAGSLIQRDPPVFAAEERCIYLHQCE